MSRTKVALSSLVAQAWTQLQGTVLEEVRKKIEELAEAERDSRVALFLRRVQGFSWKEIAKKQGVSGNTAIKTYSRGLERVRERMLSKPNESQSGDGSPTRSTGEA